MRPALPKTRSDGSSVFPTSARPPRPRRVGHVGELVDDHQRRRHPADTAAVSCKRTDSRPRATRQAEVDPIRPDRRHRREQRRGFNDAGAQAHELTRLVLRRTRRPAHISRGPVGASCPGHPSARRRGRRAARRRSTCPTRRPTASRWVWTVGSSRPRSSSICFGQGWSVAPSRSASRTASSSDTFISRTAPPAAGCVSRRRARDLARWRAPPYMPLGAGGAAEDAARGLAGDLRLYVPQRPLRFGFRPIVAEVRAAHAFAVHSPAASIARPVAAIA